MGQHTGAGELAQSGKTPRSSVTDAEAKLFDRSMAEGHRQFLAEGRDSLRDPTGATRSIGCTCHCGRVRELIAMRLSCGLMVDVAVPADSYEACSD